jgi:hypothetical protein
MNESISANLYKIDATALLKGNITMRFFLNLNYAILLFIVSIIFGGCSREENAEEQQSANKTVSEIAIPSAIKSAALPNNATLIANVYIDYVDSNSTPAATQELTLPVTGNVEFTLEGISLGDHTFTIIFEYTNDPNPAFAGTFELARATSDVVTIVAGSNPSLTFSDTDYDTSADDDNDGLTNLTELDESMRTNPGNSECVLDSSLLDLCTLG